jgi:hypothetical protein
MPRDEEKDSSAISGSAEDSDESDERTVEGDTAGPTTVDVLKYGAGDSATYVTVPSGTGTQVIGVHRRDASRSRLVRTVVFVAVALIAAIVGTLFASLTVGVAVALGVAAVGAAQEYLRVPPVPDLVDESVLSEAVDDEYEIDLHVDEPIKEGASVPEAEGDGNS